MATKDNTPGLLSKVAKFVRNPTTDWAELDNPVSEPDTGYSKQALKEMIAWIVAMTGIHKDEAYAMCSFAADLHVTQTVNNIKGVHAMLPKSILRR